MATKLRTRFIATSTANNLETYFSDYKDRSFQGKSILGGVTKHKNFSPNCKKLERYHPDLAHYCWQLIKSNDGVFYLRHGCELRPLVYWSNKRNVDRLCKLHVGSSYYEHSYLRKDCYNEINDIVDYCKQYIRYAFPS